MGAQDTFERRADERFESFPGRGKEVAIETSGEVDDFDADSEGGVIVGVIGALREGWLRRKGESQWRRGKGGGRDALVALLTHMMFREERKEAGGGSAYIRCWRGGREGGGSTGGC